MAKNKTKKKRDLESLQRKRRTAMRDLNTGTEEEKLKKAEIRREQILSQKNDSNWSDFTLNTTGASTRSTRSMRASRKDAQNDDSEALKAKRKSGQSDWSFDQGSSKGTTKTQNPGNSELQNSQSETVGDDTLVNENTKPIETQKSNDNVEPECTDYDDDSEEDKENQKGIEKIEAILAERQKKHSEEIEEMRRAAAKEAEERKLERRKKLAYYEELRKKRAEMSVTSEESENESSEGSESECEPKTNSTQKSAMNSEKEIDDKTKSISAENATNTVDENTKTIDKGVPDEFPTPKRITKINKDSGPVSSAISMSPEGIISSASNFTTDETPQRNSNRMKPKGQAHLNSSTMSFLGHGPNLVSTPVQKQSRSYQSEKTDVPPLESVPELNLPNESPPNDSNNSDNDVPKQVSEVENKRKVPRNVNRKSKEDREGIKKRRSSIRFSEKEDMHEIPNRDDTANKTYSGSDNAESPAKKSNHEVQDSPFEVHSEEKHSSSDDERAGTSANKTSDKTLERRGRKKKFAPSKSLLERARERQERVKGKWDEDMPVRKQKALQKVNFPKTPEQGVRRSKRVRNAGHFFKRMLMEDDIDKVTGEIKNNVIKTKEDLGEYEERRRKEVFKKPQNVLTARDRRIGKLRKNKDDTLSNFGHVEDFDDKLLTQLNLEVEVVCEGQEESMIQCFSAEEFCEWSDTNDNKPISVDQGLLPGMVAMKVTHAMGGVVAGILLFAGFAFKQKVNVSRSELHMDVKFGGFLVTINEHERIVRSGESFMVPPENSYSVKNLFNKRGEIKFTVIKDRPPVARNRDEFDQNSSIRLARDSIFSPNATSTD